MLEQSPEYVDNIIGNVDFRVTGQTTLILSAFYLILTDKSKLQAKLETIKSKELVTFLANLDLLVSCFRITSLMTESGA